MEESQPEYWWRSHGKKCAKNTAKPFDKETTEHLLEHAYLLADKISLSKHLNEPSDKNCDSFKWLVTRLPEQNIPESILIKALYDGVCDGKTLNSESQTAHFIANNFKFSKEIGLDRAIQKPALKKPFLELIALEDQLASQGYLTFIHGQNRQFRVPVLLHTFLQQCSSDTKKDDFLLLHVKPKASKKEVEKDILFRKSIIEKGTPDDCHHCPDEKRLLFMNHAAFANGVGENSFEYVTSNRNQSYSVPRFKDIFAYNNYKNLYGKFSGQLDELHKEHIATEKFGTLLLIAIPKEKASEYVYRAEPFGRKKNNEETGLAIPQIIDLLKKQKQPWYSRMFCMPVTADTALDPNSGIKVFAFDTGDPKKLEEWHTKKDNVFAQIAVEIQKQNSTTKKDKK